MDMFYMRGTYWAQQPRETSILQTQLVTNLVSALQAYNNEVRKFPQHIMVFRGGVSEGEYQKHFFINMTSELKPSIPTKFWA
ncbi:nuclear RNAi defective-3 protein-like [Ditylenchus destructor]|uniref:Nuclear RNAi defective-3 protein-like n=1 Tax=Ditylenchus destructor TaxID=166010 RepID=A0AAD4MHS4_9BILA|nr:nuclear RNAi defective-3 protein-like [Ditylenchus destructor]